MLQAKTPVGTTLVGPLHPVDAQVTILRTATQLRHYLHALRDLFELLHFNFSTSNPDTDLAKI